MTRQEFYEKHGSAKVKFSSYYKYTFTYAATLPDGKTISCEYGGNNEDIYRHEVNVDSEETVNSLQPFAGSIYEGDNLIESFYDY